MAPTKTDSDFVGRELLGIGSAIPANTRRVRVPSYPMAPASDVVWRVAGWRVADPLSRLDDGDDPSTRAWQTAEDAIAATWLLTHPAVADMERQLSDADPTVEEGDGVYTAVGRGQAGVPGAPQPIVAVWENEAPTMLFDVAAWLDTETPILDSYVTSWDDGYTAALFTDRRARSTLACVETETGDRLSTVPIAGAVSGLEPLIGERAVVIIEGATTLVRIDVDRGTRTDLGTLPLALGEASVAASPDGSQLVVRGFTTLADGEMVERTYLFNRDLPARRWYQRERDPWLLLNPDRTSVVVHFDSTGDTWVATEDGIGGSWLVNESGDDPARHITEGVVTDWDVSKDAVVVRVMRDGIDQIEVFARESEQPRAIVRPPSPGHVAVARLDAATDSVVYEHSDLLTPWRETTQPLNRTRAPQPAHDPAPTIELRSAPGRDEVTIPYLLVRPAGVAANVPLPTIVRVYGGFGVPSQVDFDAAAAAWVRAGGAVVVAMPRGGGDRGTQWHHAGRRDMKIHTIADTIAVLEDLVASGLTVPAALGIEGASHGGWVAAQVAITRPDLVAATAAHAPVSDLIRRGNWGDEFGGDESSVAVQQLQALSPYHSALRTTARLGALLVSTGGLEDRVEPGHARKLVAAYQRASPQSLCLYRHDPNADHFADSGARPHILDAMTLTFFAEQLGLGLQHVTPTTWPPRTLTRRPTVRTASATLD